MFACGFKGTEASKLIRGDSDCRFNSCEGRDYKEGVC